MSRPSFLALRSMPELAILQGAQPVCVAGTSPLWMMPPRRGTRARRLGITGEDEAQLARLRDLLTFVEEKQKQRHGRSPASEVGLPMLS
jgi:hypothetical protein